MNTTDANGSKDLHERQREYTVKYLNQINPGWNVGYDFCRECYYLYKWENTRYSCVYIPAELTRYIHIDESKAGNVAVDGSNRPAIQGNQDERRPIRGEAGRDDADERNRSQYGTAPADQHHGGDF